MLGAPSRHRSLHLLKLGFLVGAKDGRQLGESVLEGGVEIAGALRLFARGGEEGLRLLLLRRIKIEGGEHRLHPPGSTAASTFRFGGGGDARVRAFDGDGFHRRLLSRHAFRGRRRDAATAA